MARLRDFEIGIHLTFFNYGATMDWRIEDFPTVPDGFSWRGDRKPQGPVPRSNLASYASRASRWNASFDAHWEGLRDRLLPHLDQLKVIASRCEVLCTIVVDREGRLPVLDFLRFLSDLNSDLEVDVLEG